MTELDNPFYRQYIFNKYDIDRVKLTFGDKLRVLFRPMYVQITECGVVHFKTTADGRIFIFKIEAA